MTLNFTDNQYGRLS